MAGIDSLLQRFRDIAEQATNATECDKLIVQQNYIIQKIKDIATEVEKISAPAAEKILAALGTVTLTSIGIPITVPAQLGYGVLPIFISVPLLTYKTQKLQPLYAQLKTLKEQYEANGKIYLACLEQKASEELTEAQKNLLEFETQNARSANTNTYLVVGAAIAGFLFLRNRKKKKR